MKTINNSISDINILISMHSKHINNSAAPVSETDYGSIRVQVVEWEVFICAAAAVEELNPPHTHTSSVL